MATIYPLNSEGFQPPTWKYEIYKFTHPRRFEYAWNLKLKSTTGVQGTAWTRKASFSGETYCKNELDRLPTMSFQYVNVIESDSHTWTIPTRSPTFLGRVFCLETCGLLPSISILAPLAPSGAASLAWAAKHEQKNKLQQQHHPYTQPQSSWHHRPTPHPPAPPTPRCAKTSRPITIASMWELMQAMVQRDPAKN